MAVLFIDASINKRLATELSNRGRDAVSAQAMGWKNLKDPPLMHAAARHFGAADWVMVTSDDRMPLTHGPIVAELRITLATLDGRWERYSDDQEAYKRDVVHRWAHVMAEQEPGHVRRYSPSTHRLWTPRRS